MSGVSLFLFDDRCARRWAPFTLTRPVGEMLFGCLTLRERAERVFGLRCAGHLTRGALEGFDEPGSPPTVVFDDIGTDDTRILLSSRAVPELRPVGPSEAAARLFIDDEPVGWIVPPGEPLPSELWIRDPSSSPSAGGRIDLGGTVLESPWDLVRRNPARVGADIAHLWADDSEPEGVIRIGDGGVSLGEGAAIEPGVFVDTREGPVRLCDGVRVQGPARLTGPLYVGAGSIILGGHVGASTIGAVCKVRGELTDSVLLGYVNKAHDGYLGHALVGRWVNFGAFTTNSDLKNNYGTVKVWTPDGPVDTGLTKVGCFLGDHAKTGIGTVISTGSVVGAGSNVFGGLMPPSVVPPFSWGEGPDLRDHDLARFLRTADTAMRRRGQELTPGVRRLLEAAWHATAGRRAE